KGQIRGRPRGLHLYLGLERCWSMKAGPWRGQCRSDPPRDSRQCAASLSFCTTHCVRGGQSPDWPCRSVGGALPVTGACGPGATVVCAGKGAPLGLAAPLDETTRTPVLSGHLYGSHTHLPPSMSPEPGFSLETKSRIN